MSTQQPQSRFLDVLPKEIRLQIYEHVIGHRLIHITNLLGPASTSGIAYTICAATQCCEDAAYNLTRSWTDDSCEPESLPDWEDVYYASGNNSIWLNEYSARHSRCLKLLRSFRMRSYDPALYKANEGYKVEHEHPESDLPLYQRRCRSNGCPVTPFGRQPCEHHRDLSLRYGQAGPRAFRRLHPESFLDLSNLLLVSQQVYHEARTIPFTSNTFVLHANDASEVSSILGSGHFLGWQQHAIQSFAVQGFSTTRHSGFDIRLLCQAKKLLRGVQVLSLSTNCPAGADLATFLYEDVINHCIRLPLVSRARVMVGDDHPGNWRSRVERRRQASRVETLLTKGILKDDEDPTEDDYNEDDHRTRNLEQKLEELEIPKLPWPRPAEFMAHGKYNRWFGAGN